MDEPSRLRQHLCLERCRRAGASHHRPDARLRQPAWDPEGNYLYFIGTREYQPQLSAIEFNFATNRERELLALALRKDVKNPFRPQSDEVTVAKPGEPKRRKREKKDDKSGDKDKTGNKDKKGEEGREEKRDYIRIDFDGIGDRVVQVPVDADNYFGPYGDERLSRLSREFGSGLSMGAMLIRLRR